MLTTLKGAILKVVQHYKVWRWLWRHWKKQLKKLRSLLPAPPAFPTCTWPLSNTWITRRAQTAQPLTAVKSHLVSVYLLTGTICDRGTYGGGGGGREMAEYNTKLPDETPDGEFQKVLLLKPKNTSPYQDSNLHYSGGGRRLSSKAGMLVFLSCFTKTCPWWCMNTIVCWLLNVPATCKCISGTDLLRQFYVLPHWDRSCRPNFPSHPVTVY